MVVVLKQGVIMQSAETFETRGQAEVDCGVTTAFASEVRTGDIETE